MPLSINVGLSRKASKDYQSTGVSINVTAELDQSLLAKPDELQRQVDALYAQAEQAIARQIQADAASGSASDRVARGRTTRNGSGQNGNGRNGSNGNGHASRIGGSNGNGSGGGTSGAGGGGMTASQRRAIDSIAGRLSIDASEEVRHEFGWDLERLSLREASKVIDHLKSLQPAGSGGNSRDDRH